jgi:hypothetical protein
MVENIIVSEVSWVQKAEGCIFLSYVENKLNTEYKHYCIDIEIYTKSETGRDQERRKRRER